jgi:hypothetical protein
MTNRVKQLSSEADQRARSPHVVQYSTQSQDTGVPCSWIPHFGWIPPA